MNIFLSHSSSDKEIARKLAQDLQNQMIDVWFDEWAIRLGDSITQKIQQGLGESKYVAVLLSSKSVKSGWVEKEWQSKIGIEARTNQTIILPILTEPCDIPVLLEDKKYVDLSKDYARAVSEIVSVVKSSPSSNENQESLISNKNPNYHNTSNTLDYFVYLLKNKSPNITYIKAVLYCFLTSIFMTGISTVSYITNGVSLNSTLYLLDSVITSVFLIIYGFQLWLASKFFRSKESLLKFLTAYFNSSLMVILVLGKVVEIPTRIIRDKELLKGGLTSLTAENMTSAIHSNSFSFAAELFVLLVYIVFFIQLVKLIKSVHEFGTSRSILTGAIGLCLISITVSWLQRPVTHALLNSFSI